MQTVCQKLVPLRWEQWTNSHQQQVVVQILPDKDYYKNMEKRNGFSGDINNADRQEHRSCVSSDRLPFRAK